MLIRTFRSPRGANFSYLIGDSASRRAALIDPGRDIGPYLEELRQGNWTLTYLLLTHGHGDHTEGVAPLRQKLPFTLAAHRDERSLLTPPGLAADRWLVDGENLELGELVISVIHTPGHTPGGLCYLFAGRYLFTGDTIFIGDSGRTDLPGGEARTIYLSAQAKLKGLPDSLLLCPGHDYGPVPSRTLGQEKLANPIFSCPTFEEFDRA